jgi:hypothetical protein
MGSVAWEDPNQPAAHGKIDKILAIIEWVNGPRWTFGGTLW